MEQQNAPVLASGGGDKGNVPDPVDRALAQLRRDMIEVLRRMDDDPAYRGSCKSKSFEFSYRFSGDKACWKSSNFGKRRTKRGNSNLTIAMCVSPACLLRK